MRERKTVFTTGEVARICNVAPRTVSKWFDSGQLRGYRIPGSKDRRIPVEHLVRFMQTHGIPLNGLDVGRTQILLFDADEVFGRTLSDSLAAAGAYDVTVAATPLAAGAAAQENLPHVFLVDVPTAGLPPQVIVRFVRLLDSPHPICLIATGNGLTNGQGQGLLQAGFDAYLPKPFDTRTLVELIENEIAAAAEQVG